MGWKKWYRTNQFLLNYHLRCPDLGWDLFTRLYIVWAKTPHNILVSVSPHLYWWSEWPINRSAKTPPRWLSIRMGFMLGKVWRVSWQALGFAEAFPVSRTQDQVSPFSQHLLVLFNRKWGPSEEVWPKLSQNGPWQAGILACDGSQ